MAQTEPAVRIEEQPPAPGAGEPDEGGRVLDLLIVVAKRKWFVLKFVGAAAILSIVISLLLPSLYTAETRLMPPQQSQSMSVTAMLGQLGPLASLAGKDMGLLKNPSDLYVSVLQSRTVADDLIDRFSLMRVYDQKYRVDAQRKLSGRSSIKAEKDGTITIDVEDRDPQRAADLANAYVDELQKLTKTLAVSEASRRRIFFEQEMKQASQDLARAKDALKQTQEKTGILFLEPQSKAMISMAASLRAQVAAKEAEVASMRSFATPDNPDLVRAQQELAALQGQVAKMEGGPGKRGGIGDIPLEDVPSAGLEYVRKYRDVMYHQALYELLTKQYEAARIDEGRDSVMVQQLDRAVRPEKKSWPKRGLIVLTVTILALVLAILVVLVQESLERAREDPQFTSRIQLLRFYLRGKSQA